MLITVALLLVDADDKLDDFANDDVAPSCVERKYILFDFRFFLFTFLSFFV